MSLHNCRLQFLCEMGGRHQLGKVGGGQLRRWMLEKVGAKTCKSHERVDSTDAFFQHVGKNSDKIMSKAQYIVKEKGRLSWGRNWWNCHVSMMPLICMYIPWWFTSGKVGFFVTFFKKLSLWTKARLLWCLCLLITFALGAQAGRLISIHWRTTSKNTRVA